MVLAPVHVAAHVLRGGLKLYIRLIYPDNTVIRAGHFASLPYLIHAYLCLMLCGINLELMSDGVSFAPCGLKVAVKSEQFVLIELPVSQHVDLVVISVRIENGDMIIPAVSFRNIGPAEAVVGDKILRPF